MKRFKATRKGYEARLEDFEIELLTSFTGQLIELVDPGDEPDTAAGVDDFELWARDLADTPDQPQQPEDPVIRRLFPDAYPHDAVASSDFRRYTEHDLRTQKVAEARVVLADLERAAGNKQVVVVSRENTDPWLRTLNALRISLATRLGITDADSVAELQQAPEDDPRSFLYSVMEWLGFAQETLLTAMTE